MGCGEKRGDARAPALHLGGRYRGCCGHDVEVNRFNRAEFSLTFFIADEQRVAVTRDIGLDGMVPAALRAEIDRLAGNMDGWATALAGGRGQVGQALDPTEVDTRFTIVGAVMVELEGEQRVSVGPATVARTFENDTRLLLKTVCINEQRRREMRMKARSVRDESPGRAEQVARAR